MDSDVLFLPFGIRRRKADSYTYRCPICRKRITLDCAGEPCCTGPSDSRDDHELTVMLLENTDNGEVSPEKAIERANGPLIIPHGN